MNKPNSKLSDTFCIMPWVHLHVAQNGNVIPCCQAPPHKVHRFGTINEETISDIWNGEAIQQFRRKMLEGKEDVRCKQCYLKEDQGWQSLRQTTNQKFEKQIKQVTSDTENTYSPVYFDIRFSNACNLKCRICGPWASSQWYKDAVALGMRKKGEKALTLAIKNEEHFFEELLPFLKNAKEFYFAGGEPLMMEQHYKVLDALIAFNNTDIQLAYNTNFSTLSFKDYNVVEYWKKFKNIRIAASLDATDERGELLRKNLNWKKVIENRQTLLKEVPHVVFEIAPTICIFNVAHIPDFHKEWVNKKWVKIEDFVPNVLIHPKEYHFNVLPLETQLLVKQKYIAHIDWMLTQTYQDQKKFNSILAQFKSIAQELGTVFKEELDPILKTKIALLDTLRKENTSSIFPELEEL